MISLEDLLDKSIPELHKLFVERRRPVPKGLLEALDGDNVRARSNSPNVFAVAIVRIAPKVNDSIFCCALKSSCGLTAMVSSPASTKPAWRHSPDP